VTFPLPATGGFGPSIFLDLGTQKTPHSERRSDGFPRRMINGTGTAKENIPGAARILILRKTYTFLNSPRTY
jgi:hypothetical protein